MLRWVFSMEWRIKEAAREARDIQAGEVRDVLGLRPVDLARAQAAMRTLERLGVPWVKVHAKIGERSGDTSTALKSLEDRGLVIVERTPSRRATHVRLTPSGRKAAKLAPYTERSLQDAVRRQIEKLHGPREAWTEDTVEEYHQALSAVLGAAELMDPDIPLRFSIAVPAELAREYAQQKPENNEE